MGYLRITAYYNASVEKLISLHHNGEAILLFNAFFSYLNPVFQIQFILQALLPIMNQSLLHHRVFHHLIMEMQ